MQLNKRELDRLGELKIINSTSSHTSGGILYEDENFIYKISNIPDDSYNEYVRNIEYLIKNPIINTPKVYEKIYVGNKVCGYITENIKNSISFRNAIKQNIKLEDKLKIICDIHLALKELHSKNLNLGDINLDKIFISNNNGYIVNLDAIRFYSDKPKFNETYNIKMNSKTFALPTNQYSDLVKLMLSSLSIILEIDLETLISNRDNTINMENLYNTVIFATGNKSLIDYFKKIIDGNMIYFDDFLKENHYIKEEKEEKII